MSARMATTVEAPGDGAMDVHEWLEHVDDGIDLAALDSSPLARVCTSAVDPLEIAVALEVAGISHAVVTERYDRADVFSLARTLWDRVPLQPVAARTVDLPRSGDRRDLARGILYAAPALMLLALTSALNLDLERWVLPLAISWGWGLGQVTAFVGYRVHAGGHSAGAAKVVARVIVGAAGSTCLLSTVAVVAFGGSVASVAAATGLVTYMVSSAILLVRAEERWLALLLIPGTLASPIVLAMSRESVASQAMAIVFIGGSFLAVLCRALRTMRGRTGGRVQVLARRDVLIGCAHLLHGVFCGLALSLVVIQTGHASAENELARMLLPVPLVATLGVMEWQLRTFRSRVAHLTHSLESSRAFPTRAWHEFLRSLAVCVGANATVAMTAIIAIRVHGGQLTVGAMTLQGVLGAVFFTDLIVVMFDRIDLVVRSWLAGVAIGSVALLGISVFSDTATNPALFRTGAVAVSVVLVALLVSARTVVTVAMNH